MNGGLAVRHAAQRARPGVTGAGFPWPTPLTSPSQTQQAPPLTARDSTRGLGGIHATHDHHATPVMTILAQTLESACSRGLQLPLRVSQSPACSRESACSRGLQLPLRVSQSPACSRESACSRGLQLPLRVSQSSDHDWPGVLTTHRGPSSLLSLTGPFDKAGAVASGFQTGQ